MLKNSLFSPLCLAPFFCFSLFFFLSFSAAPLFLFLFPVSHAAVLLQPSFSFLFVCCPLFFSPKYFFFSPNVFQPPNTFFSPKLFSVQPNFFFFFLSSTTLLFFFFLLYSFLVQPSFFFFFFQRLLFSFL